VLIAMSATLFTLFDGMNKMNVWLDELNEFINNYGAEEKILFCDSGKTSIESSDDMVCRQCPEHAIVCRNGKVQCKTNYILQDNKCILDGVVVKFAYDLNKQVHQILSQRRGKYECGEMPDIEGAYTMKQDELISNCHILDPSKKDEAFKYFQKNILSESSIIKVNEKNEYYSLRSIKSPFCRIKEWAIGHMLGLIATFIIIVIVFAIWCKYKRRKWEKKEVEKMVVAVYDILAEFDRFNKQRYAPIDVIKQRIKPKSNKLWKRLDALIQKDANIQKSIRMMDGMQKKCLALNSSSSVRDNNMENNMNNQYSQSQSYSPSYHMNQNNNYGRSPNQMQPNQFPQYSKRNMW